MLGKLIITATFLLNSNERMNEILMGSWMVTFVLMSLLMEYVMPEYYIVIISMSSAVGVHNCPLEIFT